jgi:hypothetical protein
MPQDRTLDQAQRERIVRIKNEAATRIDAIMPDWKQRNTLARGLAMALGSIVAGKPLSDADKAEVAAVLAVWGQITAIRAASDVAEAAVLAATTNDDADGITW